MITLNHDHHLHNPANGLIVDEKKEEKIALARQKLKQYKKEKEARQHLNGAQMNANEDVHILTSGRSTPASAISPSSYSMNNQNNNYYQQQQQQQPTAATLSPPPAPILTNNSIQNIDHLNHVNLKEQLQLHVQTIGILVAEKAELKSKLQQQVKKSDKKQEECDELMGRLKASRQKITDLEKLIQQLGQEQQNQQLSLDMLNSDENKIDLERLRNDLSTNQLLVNELKIRLNESNEKFQIKHQETQKLNQFNLELKSQLEIMTLKLQQLYQQQQQQQQNNNGADNNSFINDNLLLEELKEKNVELQRKLDESNKTIQTQNEKLKSEYESYVDQMRHQIESLVDQINRLTDERENSFAKIDHLESVVSTTKKTNESLINDLNDLKKKLQNEQQKQHQTSSSSQDLNTSNEKILLLENEIKYFKQQIEILLVDQSQLKNELEDKDITLSNLNKLIEKYESDREQINRLLEQSHSDKQTISRILKQNNDLKDQFTELQDAYVQVTKQNLELTTQLQAEQFKYKQLYEQSQSNQNNNNNNNNSNNDNNLKQDEQQEDEDENNEWSENDTNNEHQQNNDGAKNNTLLDGLKQKLDYLQKENTDLNDYITLVNKQLAEKSELIQQMQASLSQSAKQNQQPQTAQDNDASNNNNDLNDELERRKNDIILLKETIKELELEKNGLFEKLELLKSSNDKTSHSEPTQDTNSNNNINNSQTIQVNEAYINNMKLLEEKFNKIMKDNADLIEKNQELEHIIQQLQFETETIIDYISMYQMERLKLNEKYKQKDESIKSLATQLQVNKLALTEMTNYLNAFIKMSMVNESDEAKLQNLTKNNNSDENSLVTNENNEESADTVIVKETDDENTSSNSANTNINSNNNNNNSNNESDEKKVYLLNQIQQLLNDLTNKTSNTLKQTTANNAENNKNAANKMLNSLDKKLNDQTNNIDPKSVADFKMNTILCSNCYGDLFIV